MDNFQIKQSYSIPDPLPNNMGQQHQSMYTQFFQCKCSRTFKTFSQYQHHMRTQNHDNYFQTQLQSQPEFSLINNYPSYIFSQQNPNPRFTFPTADNMRFDSSVFYGQKQNKKTNKPQFPVSQNIFRSEQNQAIESNSNHRRTPEEFLNQQKPVFQQKITNYKYTKNYYENKMAPFYRQLDIEPYRNPNSKKSQLQLHYQKKLQQRNNDPDYSVKTSLSQFTLIEEELYSKMIPNSNGLVDFIDQIIKQNKITEKNLNMGKKEQILRQYREKMFKFAKLNMQIQQKTFYAEFSDQDEDFLNSNILMGIQQFMNFASKAIKPSRMWILQSIFSLILDVLIQYYSQQHPEDVEIIKIPMITSFIPQIKQKLKKTPNQCVTEQNVTQTVSWFYQWASVKQYMFNKFNIDYLQPLKHNIDQINFLYRSNTKNYKECADKRRIEYKIRMKRKLIQKLRKEKNKTTYQDSELSSRNIKNSRFNIKGSSYDGMNSEERMFYTMLKEANDNFQLREDGNILPTNKSFEFPIQRLNENIRAEDKQRYETGEIKNIQKRNFAQAINQNNQYPSLFQSKRQNPQMQIEKGDSEKQQSSLNRPYVSHYVNYFSPQFEQIRKKRKEEWRIRLEQLKKIIYNPIQYKEFLKSEVQKQLEQTMTLKTFLQNQSRQMQIMAWKEPPKEPSQDDNISSQEKERHQSEADQQQLIQLENEQPQGRNNQDPFIIRKNARQKKMFQIQQKSEKSHKKQGQSHNANNLAKWLQVDQIDAFLEPNQPEVPHQSPVYKTRNKRGRPPKNRSAFDQSLNQTK